MKFVIFAIILAQIFALNANGKHGMTPDKKVASRQDEVFADSSDESYYDDFYSLDSVYYSPSVMYYPWSYNSYVNDAGFYNSYSGYVCPTYFTYWRTANKEKEVDTVLNKKNIQKEISSLKKQISGNENMSTESYRSSKKVYDPKWLMAQLKIARLINLEDQLKKAEKKNLRHTVNSENVNENKNIESQKKNKSSKNSKSEEEKASNNNVEEDGKQAAKVSPKVVEKSKKSAKDEKVSGDSVAQTNVKGVQENKNVKRTNGKSDEKESEQLEEKIESGKKKNSKTLKSKVTKEKANKENVGEKPVVAKAAKVSEKSQNENKEEAVKEDLTVVSQSTVKRVQEINVVKKTNGNSDENVESESDNNESDSDQDNDASESDNNNEVDNVSDNSQEDKEAVKTVEKTDTDGAEEKPVENVEVEAVEKTTETSEASQVEAVEEKPVENAQVEAVSDAAESSETSQVEAVEEKPVENVEVEAVEEKPVENVEAEAGQENPQSVDDSQEEVTEKKETTHAVL